MHKGEFVEAGRKLYGEVRKLSPKEYVLNKPVDYAYTF